MRKWLDNARKLIQNEDRQSGSINPKLAGEGQTNLKLESGVPVSGKESLLNISGATPRHRLRILVDYYGRSIIDDPRRCEGLLRDFLGDHKREINILIGALKEGVTTQLIRLSASTPSQVLLARLAKKLEDNQGLAEQHSRWAVESWAIALGIVTEEEVQSYVNSLSMNGSTKPSGNPGGIKTPPSHSRVNSNIPQNSQATSSSQNFNAAPRVKGPATQAPVTGTSVATPPIVSSSGVAELIVSKLGGAQFKTISEAIKAAQPGSRILVRPGFYQENFILDKKLEIIGDGPIEQIVIEGHDDYQNRCCILMQTDSALVQGLTLYMSGGHSPSVVSIPRGKLLIRNCVIAISGGWCIKATAFDAKPIIQKCIFQGHKGGGGNGISFTKNAQGQVEDCDILASIRIGINISNGASPLIQASRITASAHGVEVERNGSGIIQECDIEKGSTGVVISEGGNPLIKQCRIFDGKGSNSYSLDVGDGGGILVSENGEGRIEDCEIFQNHKAGIHIKRGGNPRIAGCKIYKNKGVAIYVEEFGAGIIESNDLRRNEAGAWKIEPGCPVQYSANLE